MGEEREPTKNDPGTKEPARDGEQQNLDQSVLEVGEPEDVEHPQRVPRMRTTLTPARARPSPTRSVLRGRRAGFRTDRGASSAGSALFAGGRLGRRPSPARYHGGRGRPSAFRASDPEPSASGLQ